MLRLPASTQGLFHIMDQNRSQEKTKANPGGYPQRNGECQATSLDGSTPSPRIALEGMDSEF